MTIKEIHEAIKLNKATKVFINPADTAKLFANLLPFSSPIPAGVDLPATGKGTDWYEDANVQVGSFRVE